MLRVVTVCIALFCALSVSGFAQQRVVISTLPHGAKGTHFAAPAPGQAGAPAAALPYVEPVSGKPGSVLLVPVDTAFSTQIDASDSAFAITDPDTDTLLAFTGLWSYPIPNSGLGYDINLPFQMIAPMGGTLQIDTIVFFMFKISAWPDLEGDMYMLPLLAPTNINWNQYQGYNIALDKFTSVPGFSDLVTISKDTINNRLTEQPFDLKGVVVPTPGLTIPANRAFGFGFMAENPEDKVRMIGGYEWDESVKPTGGMMTTRAGNDTVRSMFGNLVWNGTTPPPLTNKNIRQNFDFRIFGRFEAVTGVRPDENSNTSGVALEANYPNPASTETHIRFSIDKAAPVTLRMTNMLGQVVETTTLNDRGPGSYVWDVNTSHMATGTYIYSLSIGNQTMTRTMKIVR